MLSHLPTLDGVTEERLIVEEVVVKLLPLLEILKVGLPLLVDKVTVTLLLSVDEVTAVLLLVDCVTDELLPVASGGDRVGKSTQKIHKCKTLIKTLT